MKWALAAGLVLLISPPADAVQTPEKVIDVRAARPPAGNSFEALWTAYQKADQRGDVDGRQTAMREIRRLRVERNVHGLETLALARVAQGIERVKRGEKEPAEEEFRGAVALDPLLPDAYFGLALTDLARGPLGLAAAASHTSSGLLAPLSSVRGRHRLTVLLIPTILLALLVTATAVAVALLLHHGALLLHDIEEAVGPGRGGGMAVAVYVLVLVLPAVTLQGYGWLPLWWLALMFLYVSGLERVVIGLLLVSCIAVGPLVHVLKRQVLADHNPLFKAGVQAIEGGPDSRAITSLEDAVRRHPDDHDLVYLLGAQYKKAGRYDESASLYRELLRVAPSENYALNNLANLEFAAGEFQAAIARYKQGIDSGPPPKLGATLSYNLSLAHLQRFEFQPAQAARDQADRLDSGLIRSYDSAWRYDKGDYAVVDLSLTPAELWAKFMGTRDGIARKNQIGKGDAGGGARPALLDVVATRFTAFLAVSLLAGFVLSRWRGARAFTRRCVKCGTPFCKHCELGTQVGGLCTQCHHLFVVRDGVSGPARNRKLLEVQAEDERRERIFRILSLLSPGAGHVYAQRPLLGLVLLLVWSFVLALILLAGRVLPFTQAAGAVDRPWGLVLAGLLLLVLYVTANRARPELEVAMPIGRRPTGRGRAA